MSDLIELAEAMGWREMISAPGNWYPPGLSPQANALGHDLPDPFTDANDCDALIRFLESKQIRVQVEWGLSSDEVTMRRKPADPDFLRWNGDDWKTGVCELALKVIDNE